jgi:diguanylate cyclase (GGDEF)-like protein/PAS domain S-box-containing protein
LVVISIVMRHKAEGTDALKSERKREHQNPAPLRSPEFTGNLLSAMLDGSPVATFAVDRDHRVIVWNKAMERTTGIAAGSVLGTKDQWRACYDTARPCLADLLVDDSADLPQAMQKWYGRVLDRSESAIDGFDTIQLLPPTIGKAARWLRMSATPIRDGSGKVVAAVETMADVTSEKTAEKSLRQSEARYRMLFERSTDAIIMLDAGRHIRSCNPAFLALFAFDRQSDVLGRSARVLFFSDEDFREYGKSCHPMTESSSVFGTECRLRRRDGNGMRAELNTFARRDAKGSVIDYVVIIRDVTDRRRQERRLAHWAEHDALTGLPNRRAFLDLLRNTIEQLRNTGRRFAVIFLDLDHFKDINDSLGHAVGDGVLIGAARRIQGLLRLSDTVARFGGDEFVVLSTGISNFEHAAGIAAKIVDSFRAPLEVDGQKHSLTASVGIAVYPDHGGETEELIKNADTAMYQAKESGRNAFVCFSGSPPGTAVAVGSPPVTQDKND